MRILVHVLFAGLGLLPVRSTLGQYFQYSQYNFTSQRINPAMTGNSRYASASANFRNQKTGGDFPINSGYLEVNYPLLNSSTGQPWSGIGVSFLNDQSGGVYKTQDVALSYAVHLRLARYQMLSLGFRALHQEMRIDLDGFYTGSQYVPDRGFNTGSFNGENSGTYRKTVNTFSTGVYWRETDPTGRIKHQAGISVFDLNRPPDSFFGSLTTLSQTIVLNAGTEVYSSGTFHLIPEALFSTSASVSMLMAGLRFQRELNPRPRQESDRVELITKYAVGRSGIVGFQLHKEKISLGLSYDFPFFHTNAGNLGALEVGLTLRTLVQTHAQKTLARRKKEVTDRKNSLTSKQRKTPASVIRTVALTEKDSAVSIINSQSLLDTTKNISPQPMILAGGKAGTLKQEPLVNEKVTLHFAFDFNSTDLDDSAEEFLQQLATTLTEHENVRLSVVGYTDNIGSEKFNLRLSRKRADAVGDYLLHQGISADRLTSEGKGMQNPLNENLTEAERAQNRRVELTLHY